MKLNTSIRKRFRVSNKVKKVASKDRFRLSISRSSKNISAQIIDDTKNVTLLSASSIEKDLRSVDKVNKIELSKLYELLSRKSAIKEKTPVKIVKGKAFLINNPNPLTTDDKFLVEMGIHDNEKELEKLLKNSGAIEISIIEKTE